MTTDPRDQIIADLYEQVADIAEEHGQLLGLKPAFVRLLLKENPEPDDLETFLRAGAEKYGVPIQRPDFSFFMPDTVEELLRLIDGGKS
jgi:hypothetical protein